MFEAQLNRRNPGDEKDQKPRPEQEPEPGITTELPVRTPTRVTRAPRG
jgi:hypothetical protein